MHDLLSLYSFRVLSYFRVLFFGIFIFSGVVQRLIFSVLLRGCRPSDGTVSGGFHFDLTSLDVCYGSLVSRARLVENFLKSERVAQNDEGRGVA